MSGSMASGSGAGGGASDDGKNEKVTDLFTLVPCDLFRSGNATSARLENVRPDDVATVDEKNPDGSVTRYVLPGGGISTFNRDWRDTLGKERAEATKMWKIPAGTALPARIRITKDKWNSRFRATHYSIAPAYKMKLSEFIEALTELGKSAVKMFASSINQSGGVSVPGVATTKEPGT